MADIIKVDLTDVQDTLQGTYQQSFELTDYTDSATISLASGCTESLGDDIYRVESGDLTITDDGLSDGTVYVLVLDDGDGTASAYLSTKGGTFDPNKRGYFINDASADDGAKVVFTMSKYSGVYYGKTKRDLKTISNLKAGQLINIDDSKLSNTSAPRTSVYSYGNSESTNSSTYTKLLDITYAFSGKMYITANCVFYANSSFSGSTTWDMAIYINDIITASTVSFTNTYFVTGAVANRSIGLLADIEPDDNIQIYGKASQSQCSVDSVSMSLSVYDLLGTYDKGTPVL